MTPEQQQRLGAALSVMLQNITSILFPRCILAAYGKSLVVSQSLTPRLAGKSVSHDTELESKSLGKCWVRFDHKASGKPITVIHGDMPVPSDDSDKARSECESERAALVAKCPIELHPKLTYDRATHSAFAKRHALVKIASDAQLRTACVLARSVRILLSGDNGASLSKSQFEAARCSFASILESGMLDEASKLQALNGWLELCADLLCRVDELTDPNAYAITFDRLIGAVLAAGELPQLTSKPTSSGSVSNAAPSRSAPRADRPVLSPDDLMATLQAHRERSERSEPKA